MSRRTSLAFLLALCAFGAVTAVDYTKQTDSDAWPGNCQDTNIVRSPIALPALGCRNIAVFDLSFQSDAVGTFTWSDDLLNYVWQPDTSFGSLGVLKSDNATIANYTAQYAQFKAPSEHSFNGKRADLELQIFFKNAIDDEMDAFFSVLIYKVQAPSKSMKESQKTDLFDSIDYDLTNADTIELGRLAQRINDLPHFYRYTGTNTVPDCEKIVWMVYTSPIYVSDSVVDTFVTAINNQENTNNDLTLKDSEMLGDEGSNAKDIITISGTDFVEKFCYKEFWRNAIPFNYGLWFHIGILSLYFCFQLCTSNPKPLKQVSRTREGMSAHPIVSLYMVNNSIFTRRSRYTMLWMNLMNIGIITAAFAANDPDISDDTKITAGEMILYGLAGSILGGIFTYLWGFFLRKYYIAKYGALKRESEEQQPLQGNKDVDYYLNQANYYLYIYYFMVFIWAWGGGWLFIWQMGYINPIHKIGVVGQSNKDRSVAWVAAFFIAVGFDWLVFDLILAILATKIDFVRNILKWKGYVYDNQICHATYEIQAKKE